MESFQEMPGLSITLEQGSKLFGLQLLTCEVVLNGLVAESRLLRSPDGRYRLAS